MRASRVNDAPPATEASAKRKFHQLLADVAASASGERRRRNHTEIH
jgi:hypothetical protein